MNNLCLVTTTSYIPKHTKHILHVKLLSSCTWHTLSIPLPLFMCWLLNNNKPHLRSHVLPQIGLDYSGTQWCLTSLNTHSIWCIPHTFDISSPVALYCSFQLIISMPFFYFQNECNLIWVKDYIIFYSMPWWFL